MEDLGDSKRWLWNFEPWWVGKRIFPLTEKGNLGEGVWTGIKEKMWVWNPVGTKVPMGHLGRTV